MYICIEQLNITVVYLCIQEINIACNKLILVQIFSFFYILFSKAYFNNLKIHSLFKTCCLSPISILKSKQTNALISFHMSESCRYKFKF